MSDSTTMYFLRSVGSLPPHASFEKGSFNSAISERPLEQIEIIHNEKIGAHSLIGMPELISLAEQAVIINDHFGKSCRPGFTIHIIDGRAFLKFSEQFDISRGILKVNPNASQYNPHIVLRRLQENPFMSLGIALSFSKWLEELSAFMKDSESFDFDVS